jgi:hypothetical protein
MLLSWYRRFVHQKTQAKAGRVRVRPRRRVLPQLEALEDRAVPSTITWINRGQASDDFAAVFRSNASLARLARLPEPVPATLVHAPVSSNPSAVDLTVAVPPADRSAPEPHGGLSRVDLARLSAEPGTTLSSGNGPCFPHGSC